MQADTVHLSRNWLNSVFWLIVGLALGALVGCVPRYLNASLSGGDVCFCVDSSNGEHCYKDEGSSPESQGSDTLE
jgi:hypothetical protein